jgi:sporulation protein YlmC with PRC-barrel domain
MRVDLDIQVHCADGPYGELADVIIDPTTRRLTHFVIHPKDHEGLARLVPVQGAQDHLGSADLRLRWTIEDAASCESIEESAFLEQWESAPALSGWDIGIQDVFTLPEAGSLGTQALGAGMGTDYDQHVVLRYHRIPKGEVEIRRESAVTSCDGHHLGHVVGFVIDGDERIVHLVLEHGHLWGKRQLAIPAAAIQRLETDAVTLSLSQEAVGELKPLPRS